MDATFDGNFKFKFLIVELLLKRCNTISLLSGEMKEVVIKFGLFAVI